VACVVVLFRLALSSRPFDIFEISSLLFYALCLFSGTLPGGSNRVLRGEVNFQTNGDNSSLVEANSSSNSSSSGSSISRKKRKTTQPELEPEEYRLALERLALLYVQSQRADKAAPGLEELGYTCRLASSCLDYPLQQPTNISRTKVIPPCILCDNFLSKAQQDHLQAILQDRQSAYWVDHAYAVEPPSPYFSTSCLWRMPPSMAFWVR